MSANKHASIRLTWQSLIHIFWTVMILLFVYVVFLLYRVAKRYRVERKIKLEATKKLMQRINDMKLAYLSDMKINPDTTITSATMLTTRSSSQLSTLRRNNEFINMAIRDAIKEAACGGDRPTSKMETNKNGGSTPTDVGDEEHTLFISDSLGRVVHEIPFRERDYLEALFVVDENRSKQHSIC